MRFDRSPTSKFYECDKNSQQENIQHGPASDVFDKTKDFGFKERASEPSYIGAQIEKSKKLKRWDCNARQKDEPGYEVRARLDKGENAAPNRGEFSTAVQIKTHERKNHRRSIKDKGGQSENRCQSKRFQLAWQKYSATSRALRIFWAQIRF